MPAVDLGSVANYKMFHDFAMSDVSDKTIANVGVDFDRNCKSIIPAINSDFIGNIGRSKDTKAANVRVRDLFRTMISDMFGGEDNIPSIVKDAMKLDDYGHGRPLTARRIRAVFAAIEVSTLWGNVEGDGADPVKQHLVLSAGLEKAKDPRLELYNRMSSISTAELQVRVADQMGKLIVPGGGSLRRLDLDKGDTDFDIGLRSCPTLTRNGVPVNPAVTDWITLNGKPLSKDSDTARNQFAQFLTDDPNATFASLSNPLKLKVHVLMSCATQSVIGGMQRAVQSSFVSDASGRAFSTTATSSLEMKFAFRKRDPSNIESRAVDPGAIMVDLSLTEKGPEITLNEPHSTAKTRCFLDTNSSATYSMTFTLHTNTMDKFAGAKWEDLDRTTTAPVEDGTPHGSEKAAETLKEDFRLDVGVATTFSMKVDKLYSDPARTVEFNPAA